MVSDLPLLCATRSLSRKFQRLELLRAALAAAHGRVQGFQAAICARVGDLNPATRMESNSLAEITENKEKSPETLEETFMPSKPIVILLVGLIGSGKANPGLLSLCRD